MTQLWCGETENDETLVTSVPSNNPGRWTHLPIPTSIVRLPFSHPFQLQGRASGPAQDVLQLRTEGLN